MILNVEQAHDLAETYFDRRRKFTTTEDEMTSFLVAVMNYGDHFTKVICINGEWSGTKGDLEPQDTGGIPKCPNGHVLFENRRRLRLGLVEESI